MLLNKHDLGFVLKKTNLSLKKLLVLIEEDRDFELVIDSIASKLTEEDDQEFNKLSNKFKIKIVLYNLSRNTDYDITEKSYISEILCQNFKQIYSQGYLLKKGQKQVITQFIKLVNDSSFDNNKLSVIANNFSKMGKRDISDHLLKWVNIIKESKKYFNKCN